MSARLFDRFTAKVVPHLPARFREGAMPYLFFLVWLLIAVMFTLTAVSPSSSGIPLPLVEALFLLVLQLLFICGAPILLVLNLGLFGSLLLVLGNAVASVGIYASAMAWLVVIPIISFYVQGRRAGFVWLGIVFLSELLMAYLTWAILSPSNDMLGASQDVRSFATYSVITLIVASVPFLYGHLFRQIYAASLQRHRALAEKREELMRASAMREQFIATVSHELRTPMNAILGFNEMLLLRTANKPQALKILNHTRQSADHLLTVINDVLDYSQMQAGKIKIQNETFALRDTVQNAFQLFSQRAESSHVQYTCRIQEEVPQWVHTDRHRLMQVLVNLLGNAIKFTHQGHVTLRVRTQPLCVHFSVSDSGIGIAQEQQSNIFQKFSQANNAIQARYGGNGLGLSITQRVVELMGGHIGFQSKVGEGSQFWFTLPLVEVPPPVVPLPVAPLPEVELASPPRFLVVDDHPINRLLLQKILKNQWPTCHLVEAENGLQALEALQLHNFDVVLMDMVMPEMDGIQATAAMRTHLHQPMHHTPVLGLTANVNQKDLDRFSQAGVNDMVVKPFVAADLCAKLTQLITEKRSSQGS
ncbi:MAG: hybrid sensor histidine kinase/response regulator [Burkholderiaceae bacterium]